MTEPFGLLLKITKKLYAHITFLNLYKGLFSSSDVGGLKRGKNIETPR